MSTGRKAYKGKREQGKKISPRLPGKQEVGCENKSGKLEVKLGTMITRTFLWLVKDADFGSWKKN